MLLKSIDYKFQTKLKKNNVQLLPNECYTNVIAAATYDSTKLMCVGYSYDSKKNLCALHAWLESENNIHEITYPKIFDKFEYFPILKINLKDWEKINNDKFQTLDSLIIHRYFYLKFFKTYNYLAKKQTLISLGTKAQKLEKAKFPNTLALVKAYIGRLQYIINGV